MIGEIDYRDCNGASEILVGFHPEGKPIGSSRIRVRIIANVDLKRVARHEVDNITVCTFKICVKTNQVGLSFSWSLYLAFVVAQNRTRGPFASFARYAFCPWPSLPWMRVAM